MILDLQLAASTQDVFLGHDGLGMKQMPGAVAVFDYHVVLE